MVDVFLLGRSMHPAGIQSKTQARSSFPLLFLYVPCRVIMETRKYESSKRQMPHTS